MNIPQIKEWCNGLSLYQVKTDTGYGTYYHVLATSFDEAAEKVKEHLNPKPLEAIEVVPINAHDIPNSPKIMKDPPKVHVKGVELLTELVII